MGLEDDPFGFHPQALAVAEQLVSSISSPTPKALTVSVEGVWGSGKSTFMMMLEVLVWHRLEVRHQLQTELRRLAKRSASNRRVSLRVGAATQRPESRLDEQRKQQICDRVARQFARWLASRDDLSAEQREQVKDAAAERARRALDEQLVKLGLTSTAISELSREPSSVDMLRFNPWQHRSVEDIMAAFALAFERQFGLRWLRPGSWSAGFRCEFRRRWASLTPEKGWAVISLLPIIASASVWLALYSWSNWDHILHSFSCWLDLNQCDSISLQDISGAPLKHLTIPVGASVVVSTIAAIWRLASPPLRQLQRSSRPAYQDHIGIVSRFQDDLKLLVQTLTSTKRVFVFIDDLDRCEGTVAAELMAGLNFLLQQYRSHIVFVFGLDREKVAAGIAVRQRGVIEELNVDPLRYGRDFVEKFVQLKVHLPVPTERGVRRWLTEMLGEQASKQPSGSAQRSQERGGDLLLLVAKAFRFNPRRMKLFMNLFQLNYRRARQASVSTAWARLSGAPISDVQVAKFTAIAIVWPDLADAIREDPVLLRDLEEFAIDQRPLATNGTDDPFSKRIRRWVEGCEDKEALLELLGTLSWRRRDDAGRRRVNLSSPAAMSAFSLFHADVEYLVSLVRNEPIQTEELQGV